MNVGLVWAANNWPLQYYELQIRRQIELLSGRFHETSNAKKQDTKNCFCFHCWCSIHIWQRFYIFNCRNQEIACFSLLIFGIFTCFCAFSALLPFLAHFFSLHVPFFLSFFGMFCMFFWCFNYMATFANLERGETS